MILRSWRKTRERICICMYSLSHTFKSTDQYQDRSSIKQLFYHINRPVGETIVYMKVFVLFLSIWLVRKNVDKLNSLSLYFVVFDVKFLINNFDIQPLMNSNGFEARMYNSVVSIDASSADIVVDNDSSYRNNSSNTMDVRSADGFLRRCWSNYDEMTDFRHL